MRRFVLPGLLLLCGLLQPSALFGQDNTPPVMDPDNVLDDSALLVAELSVLSTDDTTRTLFYFDPARREWASYPYPEGLDETGDAEYFIRARSDGTYLINPRGFGWGRDVIDDVWVFDPTTGEFRQPDTACGVAKDLPGEGRWVIVEDHETDQRHLCFTETGRNSPAIPAQDSDNTCVQQWLKPAVTTPNEEWVLLFCGGLEFTAYSYQVQTETFLYLGTSQPSENENVEVVRWIGETSAVIHAYPSSNPPANLYYIVDVAQPASLEFVAWDLYAAPLYYDDPPHLEWMPGEFMRVGFGEYEGGLRYYDFTKREWTVYPDIAGVYGVSDIIRDGTGDRLYRSRNYDDTYWSAPSATLIRFNYETGERRELFTGEVEWVDSISADGRYVVLYLGNDGVVVSNERLAHNQRAYSPDGNAEIVIFDLTTNSIVYQATGNAWEPYGYNPFNLFTPGYNPLPVTWINEDTFFIQGVNGDHHQVIRVDRTAEIVADLGNVVVSQLSPDNQRILFRDTLDHVAVYNMGTGEITSIIKPAAVQQYDVSVDWHDSGALDVVVLAKGNTDHPLTLAHWLVAVQ
jgi:hypothetical protein